MTYSHLSDRRLSSSGYRSESVPWDRSTSAAWRPPPAAYSWASSEESVGHRCSTGAGRSGRRSRRTQWEIVRLRLFLFVASCLSNPGARSGKRYAVSEDQPNAVQFSSSSAAQPRGTSIALGERGSEFSPSRRYGRSGSIGACKAVHRIQGGSHHQRTILLIPARINSIFGGQSTDLIESGRPAKTRTRCLLSTGHSPGLAHRGLGYDDGISLPHRNHSGAAAVVLYTGLSSDYDSVGCAHIDKDVSDRRLEATHVVRNEGVAPGNPHILQHR